MSLIPKRTSFMRYARVFEILKGDNALSKKLSKNTTAVCRPDQTSQDFPVEVVHVTDTIHASGKDAYTLSKLEVIRTAHHLLVENPQPIPTPEKAEAKAPEKAEAKAPEVKTAKPKAARKPAPKATAKPAPKATAKPAPKPAPKAAPKAARKPAKGDSPPKTEATAEPSPAAVAEKPTGDVPKSDRVSSVPEFIRPLIPNVVAVAMMVNSQAVITLCEPLIQAESKGDTGAIGAKAVVDKANELINLIYRLTVLPDAKAEPSTTD